jgi:chorismate mutase
MSPLSRASDLAQLREALAQLNSEFFLTIKDRRGITLKIQEFKESTGRYSHFDPDREKEMFTLFQEQLKHLSLKELLAFSLVMEDHAMAMAPGSYPSWSDSLHIQSPGREFHEMINPLMLRFARPELFNRLVLSQEFSFLKDF